MYARCRNFNSSFRFHAGEPGWECGRPVPGSAGRRRKPRHPRVGIRPRSPCAGADGCDRAALRGGPEGRLGREGLNGACGVHPQPRPVNVPERWGRFAPSGRRNASPAAGRRFRGAWDGGGARRHEREGTRPGPGLTLAARIPHAKGVRGAGPSVALRPGLVCVEVEGRGELPESVRRAGSRGRGASGPYDWAYR